VAFMVKKECKEMTMKTHYRIKIVAAGGALGGAHISHRTQRRFSNDFMVATSLSLRSKPP